jgi:hypothetical protein
MAADTGPGTSVDRAVALVTGGFRGFGAAVAAELLDRGASKIYATSRTAQPPAISESSRSCWTSPVPYEVQFRIDRSWVPVYWLLFGGPALRQARRLREAGPATGETGMVSCAGAWCAGWGRRGSGPG